jgi:UDP-2,4-diacetamido-2,4,6-trideoxy-beta-L-altropyranose hydrolase
MALIGIRVDGSHAIGLGHVYKSLWLARTLRNAGCQLEFLITENNTARTLIEKEGFSTQWLSSDWDEYKKIKALNKWVQLNRPAALVIDHWDWSEAYWNTLEAPEMTVLIAVDTPPEGFFKFHLAFQGIRNSFQNKEFEQNGCSVFAGPRYLMTPPHFGYLEEGWKQSGKLKNILLTFGGSDVADFSLKILDRFKNLSGPYQLTLISGPGSNNHDRAKEKAKSLHHGVNLLKEVSNLPEWMCKSDLAITTAGLGTMSELALTGTPAIVFAAVDHQIKNAHNLMPIGGIINCAHEIGKIEKLFDEKLNMLVENPYELKQMSQNWRGLVDAKGIGRMVKIILERISHG